MNGSDKPRMTGSSNPPTDQLNWLADVASTRQNASQTDKLSPRSLQVSTDSLTTVGNSFSSVLFSASSLNQRHTYSQYHLQSNSPIVGSLYYSQAPRSVSYAGFYQTDPRFQYSTSVPNGTRLVRSYLQRTELYSPRVNMKLQNARSSHSPSYHEQKAPSPSHSRLAASNLLLQTSHTSEEGVNEISNTRSSPQFQQLEDSKLLSSPRDSVEPDAHSPPVISSTSSAYLALDQAASKESSGGPNLSPSNPIPYKVPTGKEGSLKHRILRPPSINIIDSAVVQDAPLSAPPIRSSSRNKQVCSEGSGYRSFSTSFIVDNGNCQLSSGVPRCDSFVEPIGGRTSQNFLKDCRPSSHTKCAPAFMKGSIIQLANSQFKPVEQMTTDDFLECEAVSPNLKIDSSTLISVEKMPSSGSAMLGFLVGEKKFQMNVEAPLEHPFFVCKQGWSSCCPERSLLRYGLNCHKLKVSDMCIFLTVKSELPACDTSAPASCGQASSPKPPLATTNTEASVQLPDNVQLVAGAPIPAQGNNRSSKRKRRWSFPDKFTVL